jgi:hypothetical protein
VAREASSAPTELALVAGSMAATQGWTWFSSVKDGDIIVTLRRQLAASK